MDGPGFQFRQEQRIFLFFKAHEDRRWSAPSYPVSCSVPTSPPPPGIKLPGYEVYRRFPFDVLRMSGAMPPLSIHLFMTWSGCLEKLHGRIQSGTVLFPSGGNLRLCFQVWKLGRCLERRACTVQL